MHDLSKEIKQALDLFDTAYKETSKTQRIILDKAKTVYLQIVLFKIPFTAPRKRKFLKLRHSLYGNDPEICLFVPNRKTGVEYKKTTEELIDFCVDYYTDILEKHKVTGIKTVMPLKQLKSEYGTYELRRKLVQRFDLFLCKNSLLYNSRFLTSLGKAFRNANKEPLGVAFPKEDVDYDPEFQRNIQRAIFTSSFYINRFSDNYSVPFGCLSNTKKELQENLQAVLHQIFNEDVIPGGFRNIRAMYLWPSQSKPVPLYMSSELPVDMKKPCVKSRRKRLRGVEGELSSQPQKKVFVTPSGEVYVTKLNKNVAGSENVADVYDSEGENSFKDESDNDDNDEDDKKKISRSKDAAAGSEDDSECEDDEQIEQEEARLLEKKRRAESDSYSNLKNYQNAKTQKTNDSKVNGKNKVEVQGTKRGSKKRSNEKTDFSKNNKLGKKKERKDKINKTKKKMLIKQGKNNFNGVDGKRKSKKKIKSEAVCRS